MKITLHKYYIKIISSKLAYFFGLLISLGNKDFASKTNAVALPVNIIILKYKKHTMNNQWINHERIHLRQYWESLGICFIISKFEYLYARIILKYSHINAYLYECQEQEAYINQKDQDYLNNRKFWSFVKFIKDKKKISFGENLELIIKDY